MDMKTIKRTVPIIILGILAPTLWGSLPGFVQLEWEPNPEAFLAGYYIYRSGNRGGPYQRLVDEPVTIPQFQEFGLSSGQIYHYRVSAVGGDGQEGNLSEELPIQAPADSAVAGGTSSTPVIQAAAGQLVILSPQRIGAALEEKGTWSQLSGSPVILIPVGDGIAAFRVPRGTGEAGLTFRYSVPGDQPGEASGADGHSDVRVVGPGRAQPSRR